MSTSTETKSVVSLTDTAAAELLRLRTAEQTEKPLRIGVKGGGCAGFSYILEFDEQQAGDSLMEIKGVPIVVDLSHELYLSGIEIDYEQGLNNRGFIFNNPNAETTCGCGSSFG